MKNPLLLAVFAWGAVAAAESPSIYHSFELEKEDGQICRLEENAPKSCIPYLQEAKLQLPDSIEIVEMAKKKIAMQNAHKKFSLDDLDAIGGTLLLSRPQLDTLVKNYKQLAFRNFGMDLSAIRNDGTSNYVPFVCSVKWVGANGLNGTINIEGELRIPMDNIDGERGALDTEQARAEITAKINQLVELKGFSDSWTEQKLAPLRALEQAARFAQFKDTQDAKNIADADADTVELIQEIVEPVVVGQAVYIPIAKALVRGIVDSLEKGLEQHQR